MIISWNRRVLLICAVAWGLWCAASATPAEAAKVAAPSYAELSSGPFRFLELQGKPFWFTLGGGGSEALLRTLESKPLADRDPVYCGVGEWGYSFHNLKNGQEDGAGYKHFGGYPTPPATRAEAMEWVRKYYMRLREDALTKATPEQRKLFWSVNGHYCYQHYACEWGCDLVGSEVGENINSIQMHIAFTRGAARQYGKPWLMDFSSWFGPSIFDEDPKRTWGENSGPTHGHSISLHARTYYVSYMAGANLVIAEGGSVNCFKSQQPGADGTLPLSSLGEKASEFCRFVRRHPDRGIAYAPIALVLPFDHGIYPGFEKKLAWNAFPYTPGDQRVLDALNVLFPGSLGDPEQPERPDRQPGNPSWKDPAYMKTESLRLVASPYGDIADVLLTNASEDVLRHYAALLLVGEFAPDAEFAERIEHYVRGGGTAIIDQADLSKGLLPSEFVAPLRAPASGGYAETRHGKGKVIVVATSTAQTPTAERPLARVLAKLSRQLIPVSVTGRVEALYSRTEAGWVVTLVNNEGVTKTFREPPIVDPATEQLVTLRWLGERKVRRAVVWGADVDQELDPHGMSVRVPPGEVRVVSLEVGEH